MRQVGVDRHAGAEAALVVVEARPRLVGDHLVPDGLHLGQPVPAAHAVAQRAGQRVHGGLEPVRRALLAPPVGGVPLGERAGAGQQPVELGVRRRVVGLVPEGDVDLEVAGDLLDEAHRLTAHLPRAALQAGQLPAQELRPVRGQARGVELPQQLAGAVTQLLRGRRRLVEHLGAHPRIAGERVDEAGLHPVEAQPQPHVLRGQVEGSGAHAGSLAARGHSPKRRCRAE